MRKFNTVCALIAYMLVLVHSITTTAAMAAHSMATWPLPPKLIFLVALLLHVLTSLYLLVKGKTQRDAAAKGRTGAHYPALNRSLYARRVSGIAVLVLALFHVITNLFCKPALFLPALRGADAVVPGALFVLMMVALLVHLVTSVEPLCVGLGVKPARPVVMGVRVLIAAILVVESVVMVCVLGGMV